METATDYVIVGKIGSTFGIKGWLKITSFTEDVTNILDYKPWYLQDHQTWGLLKVQDGREHGKGVIVKIEGYDNPETARLLTGRNIAVKRDQLPALKKHEYYWSDLKGLQVINQAGLDLGVVINIMETGANDVLIVKGVKEHGIPYLPGEVIKEIDLEKKVMTVDWDVI